MTNNINEFVSKYESEQYATTAGRKIHAKLQFVRILPTPFGDHELVEKIMASNDELKSFFGENAKTEVPIAGFIDNTFLSRRIDRLVIDDTAKIIKVLDYKTDIDTTKFREKYIVQINEYIKLLQKIYTGYKISGYILWLHNWTLETI